MSQELEKTVTNQTLLLWCGVVIVELFVIAQLMQNALVLFVGLILLWPVKAAMNWPNPRLSESGPSSDVPSGRDA